VGPDFAIRPASADDAEDFVRAYEAAWNGAMEGLVGKRLGELASFEDRVALFRNGLSDAPPGAAVWVAEREGRIVGLATVLVENGAGELRSLYVVPEEWGSGVAGALHARALTGMRELGATEATLWVVDRNGRARRFYEREGWSADGETKPSMFDVTEARYSRQL
jgi:GNAT superfamily N-acetyltransferase